MPIYYITRGIVSAVLLSLLLGGSINLAMALDATAATTSIQDQPNAVPMSDAAAAGIGCLVLAPPVVAAAYAFGPTEVMMLVTGAVIIPSSSTQLFISLGGILGSAACGLGASLTPAVISAMSGDAADTTVYTTPQVTSGEIKTVAMVEPSQPTTEAGDPAELNEDLIQSNGCLTGMLALGAITLATVPIEIVGLAAGGVTVPSNTTNLMLGVVGTVLPAGCTLGAAASLPLVALSRGLGLSSIGSGVAALFGWDQPTPTPTSSKVYFEAIQPASRQDNLPAVATGTAQQHHNMVVSKD